jgi:hypothetical protein
MLKLLACANCEKRVMLLNLMFTLLLNNYSNNIEIACLLKCRGTILHINVL